MNIFLLKTKRLAIPALFAVILLAFGSRALAGADLSYDAAGNLISVSNSVSGPAILSEPVWQGVSSNGQASLSVVIAGDGPISYQWQLNGVNVIGATGDSLL